MPIDLLDIAPPEIVPRKVQFRGKEIEVTGIPAEGWAQLYQRFPILSRIVLDVGEITEDAISRLDVMKMRAAVIAAGFGALGDEKRERWAIKVFTTDEAQMLMREIIGASMPGDLASPLLEPDEAEVEQAAADLRQAAE